MKKIAVLLLIFAINSSCTEIFECMTPSGALLDAVYIDGVLRGSISSNGVVYTDTSDEWNQKEVTVQLNFTVPHKYIVVKEYRHTGYLVSNSSLKTGKDLGYSVTSNHFFIDITKNEIDAVRAKDKKGRKCLGIDFIVDPDWEFVEYYEANAN